MPLEHERRRFRRYPLRLRARLRQGSHEVDADVLNASVGGCLLVAHLNVHPGDALEVAIPELQVPPTRVYVVRCSPTEGGFLIATCFETAVADEPTLSRASSSSPPSRGS